MQLRPGIPCRGLGSRLGGPHILLPPNLQHDCTRQLASHVGLRLCQGNRARLVQAHVVAEPVPAAAPLACAIVLDDTEKDPEIVKSLDVLSKYYGEGSSLASLEPSAVQAATSIKRIVATAVNTKAEGLRALQSSVTQGGAVPPLVDLALKGHAVAYEALQILCYRNNVTCKSVISSGIIDKISVSLSSTNDLELQSAMCFLLTGMVAFCEAAHEPVISAGLVPQLVTLCRENGTSSVSDQRGLSLQNRAAAVLRNLAHNTKNHGLLINAGAVDVLVSIIRNEKDPAVRVNAAMAVACLVGHEEGNPRLQLSEDLVIELLQVLQAACQGTMRHGNFWTVWKLCQGLASLTVNDRNKATESKSSAATALWPALKELITNNNGVEILSQVLFGKHHNNEAAHRFALSALWNLAFNETSRQTIVSTPGLVDAIRTKLLTSENSRTKEVAKGALWTLGLEEDVRTLYEGRAGPPAVRSEDGEGGDVVQVSPEEEVPHVMLSYEWGCQQSVMLMKTELQKAGYATWMDIDKMSGSTLEAMARAVEGSAVVLVCVSKRYKESQACRTEAEYAFQQRKKIIPVLMERDYKPSGWLGALMGTRLYFSMHDAKQIPNKMPGLIKELGEAGRLTSATSATSRAVSVAVSSERPENWSHQDVEEWLKRTKCQDHVAAFKAKDIDGVALCGLYRMSVDYKFVHEVLQGELGVTQLGQRLRIIEELHRLFS